MERKLAAIALMLLSGCATTSTPIVLKPPPAPSYIMQGCRPWPELKGGGRIDIKAAAAAVRDAKESYADCEARLIGAQRYIRVITE